MSDQVLRLADEQELRGYEMVLGENHIEIAELRPQAPLNERDIDFIPVDERQMTKI